MAKSIYRFDCVCGQQIETEPPTGECPSRRRLFDVTAWGKDPKVIYGKVSA